MSESVVTRNQDFSFEVHMGPEPVENADETAKNLMLQAGNEKLKNDVRDYVYDFTDEQEAFQEHYVEVKNSGRSI